MRENARIGLGVPLKWLAVGRGDGSDRVFRPSANAGEWKLQAMKEHLAFLPRLMGERARQVRLPISTGTSSKSVGSA